MVASVRQDFYQAHDGSATQREAFPAARLRSHVRRRPGMKQEPALRRLAVGRSWEGKYDAINREWWSLHAKRDALVVRVALSCVTGCGAEDVGSAGEDESAASTKVTCGGWTDLVPTNGWQSYWGGAQAAVERSTGRLAARSRPRTPRMVRRSRSRIRTLSRRRAQSARRHGERLHGNARVEPHRGRVSRRCSKTTGTVPGANAKILTSLDGAAYDTVKGAALSTAWYDFSIAQEGAFAKSVDATAGGSNAFVRMQGFVCKVDGCPASNDLNGYLFTLPSSLRPGQTVFVPDALGLGVGTNTGSWGMLSIYSSGEVYVNGNPFMANIGTSLEASFFSKTLTGNSGLDFRNGWVSYWRAPGASGSTAMSCAFRARSRTAPRVIAVLPTSMRLRDVYLVSGVSSLGSGDAAREELERRSQRRRPAPQRRRDDDDARRRVVRSLARQHARQWRFARRAVAKKRCGNVSGREALSSPVHAVRGNGFRR